MTAQHQKQWSETIKVGVVSVKRKNHRLVVLFSFVFFFRLFFLLEDNLISTGVQTTRFFHPENILSVTTIYYSLEEVSERH